MTGKPDCAFQQDGAGSWRLISLMHVDAPPSRANVVIPARSFRVAALDPIAVACRTYCLVRVCILTASVEQPKGDATSCAALSVPYTFHNRVEVAAA